jgi:hypothetical protein
MMKKMINQQTAKKILDTKAGTLAFNIVVMPSLFVLGLSAATFMWVTQKRS